MSRTRIAIGMSTAVGVAAALGVMAAPTAGAQARGHDRAFVVVADHLNNPRGLSPAPGAWRRRAPCRSPAAPAAPSTACSR